MSTVYIEKRKRKKRNSYIIYYKHPVSGKNKYYKTLPNQKEAQNEANNLRAMLDTGRVPDEKAAKKKPVLLSLSEIGDALIDSWKLKFANKVLTPRIIDPKYPAVF